MLLAILPKVAVTRADEIYNIAIVQHQVFRPFELAHNSFIQNLSVLGFKQKFRIIEDFNARSDIGALETKIKELSQRNDLDLIFSIGTHSTTRLIKHIKKTPIIFTIAGDPLYAGIVTDWKSSGANYTGVETPAYYSTVVRLMHHYVPFERLGMIYLKNSPSHEAGIAQIEHLSKELGFQFIYSGFSLRSQKDIPFPRKQIRKMIQEALDTVCPRVDAFFVQTSNTFTDEFDLLYRALVKYRIVSAGDPTNIEAGLVMGIGKDASRFGRQCAQYAIKIFEGAPPASLSMDVGSKLTIDINLKAADEIGFEPPFELVSGADNLYHRIKASRKTPTGSIRWK